MNPKVTVNNSTSSDIFIASDPNWDDQILTIDGVKQNTPFKLTSSGIVVVSVTYDIGTQKSSVRGTDDRYEMGIIFSASKDFDTDPDGYQLVIGKNGAGKLDVTDGGPEEATPSFNYRISDQNPESMLMTFISAIN
ncbi:MAG: hypothetical protein LBI66_01625 [Burkholderiaceae bacterium]|jgi:hypothetical protein|nr:hypothetical protein [Burkholderiaceae bacterium]